MRNNNKIGHLAPKGYIVNIFNSIEIEGDYHYCHNTGKSFTHIETNGFSQDIQLFAELPKEILN